MNDKYISKINQAIDYVEKNIRNELKLENIAKASGFSPFHFHRIFKSIMNENLNHFIRRIRVEKTALMIFSNPNYTITEIAFKNGFSSSQSFSREFKKFFKITPSEYKKSKICYIKSKKQKDYILDFLYNDKNSRPTISYKSLKIKNMKVEIKTLPDMTLAYIRHIGPYKTNPKLFEDLFGRLCTWAGPRNLINKDSAFLCIYYDGPEVTDESKLRLDVCLSVPNDTAFDGKIGRQEIKGGEYAITRCIIKEPKEYEKYWNEMYLNWLPQSGYQPEDKPPFEMYPADCKTENGDMIVDICIPVKKVYYIK
jgi:AraC family transcriptional regulator